MHEVSTSQTYDARKFGVMIEAKLIEWNIPYEYVTEFPVADAKLVDSTQVRSAEHRVDPRQADEYAAQMKNGSVFPPIVLTDSGIVLDGNTRLQAAQKIKRAALPAFLAKFPNMLLARAFAGAINQTGGRRLTQAEANQAATDLMRFGYADEAISRELGYSRTQIGNWRKEQQCAERAERTMVSGRLGQVKKADQWKLAQVELDAPFAAAVELVADVKPGTKELSALVKELRAATSEADQLQVIAQHRGMLVPSGPPPHHHLAVAKELQHARRAVPSLLTLRGNLELLVELDEVRRGPWIESWRGVRDMANEVLAKNGA